MKVIFLTCSISVLLFNYSSANSRPFRVFDHYPPPPPTRAERSTAISEQSFTQKLDHFDQNNGKTWVQRYFVNPEYFNNATSKIAFLKLEGESEASPGWLEDSSCSVSAKNYGAIMFQLEHRFYGKSQPFNDLSIENLRYLSSRQALADAANFIKGMNEKYSLGSDAKWIVLGGSYAGSLAAWMRLKYPDLVRGAVCSSGPLRAQFDIPEYYQVVIDDFDAVSRECVDSLQIGMEQVDDLLANPKGNESVTSIFHLCEPIEKYDLDDFSVANFYSQVVDVLSHVAQSGASASYTLNDVCGVLTNSSKGKEILRVAEIQKFNSNAPCLSYNYKDRVKRLQNTTITISGIRRQWIYQTCTEFGWYQTTEREDNVLGTGCPIDFYSNLCSEVFGPEFNESFINDQIDRTNDYYGGTNINATNVVHVHGSLDPWHPLGLLKANNPNSPAILIEGTTHCDDMYTYVEGDLPQLSAARDEVDRLIGVWLGVK